MRKSRFFAAIMALAAIPYMAGAEVMSVPYSSTLGTTSLDRDWTVVDNNNDGATWVSIHQFVVDNGNNPGYDGVYGAFSMYSEGGSMDDYLISPAIRLTAGNTYTVKFEMQSDRFYYEHYDSWEFYMSTSDKVADIAATTPLIAEDMYGYWDDHDGYRYGYQERVVTVTPETSGNYYFAFHISTPAWYNNYEGGAGIAVRDFSITSGAADPVVTPADILSIVSPADGSVIAAGDRGALSAIEVAFTGKGDIAVEIGTVSLSINGTAVHMWAVDSPDMVIDREAGKVTFKGVAAKDIYLPGEYTFIVPEGFFKQGDNTNKKLSVTYKAEAQAGMVNTPIEFVKNADGAISGLKISGKAYESATRAEVMMPVVLPDFELVVEGENGLIKKFTAADVVVNRQVINATLATPISKDGTYTATLKALSTAWYPAGGDVVMYLYNEETKASEDYSSVMMNIAEGEAEYFNFQGIKVANPDKGAYIVRRNGKTMKVVR